MDLLQEMDALYPDAVKATTPKITTFTCSLQSGNATIVHDAKYSSGGTAQTFFIFGSYLPTESELKADNSPYSIELVARKTDGTLVQTLLDNFVMYANPKSIIVPIYESMSFGTDAQNHYSAHIQLSKNGAPIATLPLSLA